MLRQHAFFWLTQQFTIADETTSSALLVRMSRKLCLFSATKCACNVMVYLAQNRKAVVPISSRQRSSSI